MTKTSTLYQELFKLILIDNEIKRLTFKGNNNFAKKYKYVEVLFDGEKYTLSVHATIKGIIFSQFYFDFTLDYAKLIEMLEMDLFNFTHGITTQYFDIEINIVDLKKYKTIKE